MYKKILVPLDGSSRAEAILPHIEELAIRYSAEVVFLRIVDTASFVSGLDGVPVALSQDLILTETDAANKYLRELSAKLKDKDIRAKGLVEYGPPVEVIVDVAEREDVDVVAIASHGRTGLSRFFYGSVAAGVLQRIDRPLLIIRAAQ